MPKRVGSHLRGNVVGYIALFVALSGTAIASGVIRVPANSVGTKQLENGAVTGRKVAKHTLTGTNIRASTLGIVPSALFAADASEAADAATLAGNRPQSFQSRVTGSCSLEAISQINADGTVNCQASVAQMMGGNTANSVMSSTMPTYLAPSGLSKESASPSDVSDITGARSGRASGLEVLLMSAPTGPVTFTLDIGGNATAITCTVRAAVDSCGDDLDSVPVPAGSVVTVQFTSPGPVSVAVGRIQFGWLETF